MMHSRSQSVQDDDDDDGDDNQLMISGKASLRSDQKDLQEFDMADAVRVSVCLSHNRESINLCSIRSGFPVVYNKRGGLPRWFSTLPRHKYADIGASLLFQWCSIFISRCFVVSERSKWCHKLVIFLQGCILGSDFILRGMRIGQKRKACKWTTVLPYVWMQHTISGE